jgi:hypothetical protein
MNPGVAILECINAAVDVDKVLGIGAFSMEKMLQKDPEFLVGDPGDPSDQGVGVWESSAGNDGGHVGSDGKCMLLSVS